MNEDLRWFVAGVIVLVAASTCTDPSHARDAAADYELPTQHTIEGPATVVDGDTLHVFVTPTGYVIVRLEAMDAPESKQSCAGPDGVSEPMGQRSTLALKGLVQNKIVACRLKERDKYGRQVGTCFQGGLNGPDVGRKQVRTGMAFAYRFLSKRYVHEDDEARASNLGVWQFNCQKPWDYRMDQRKNPKR